MMQTLFCWQAVKLIECAQGVLKSSSRAIQMIRDAIETV